ncbi:SDR family NAD(P)-dependent oxidoreductase [SAR202 cluster bacterium AD-802-F09_MRT_200m]|nr:SDR family NAD(P)-dependent oxidoreductase [SAR202 cluster bacterium AD-802-F09_MRT_200m]
MNILVTGGAGFIGSHLAEGLLAQGHQVVAFDNLATGNLENVKQLRNNPSFHLVDGSVLDQHRLEPLIAEADQIFHLAAAVGVQLIMERQVESLESNVQGTENVISLAHKLGNKKVILASSSEVYGKSPEVPWIENADILLGPTSFGRWGYACSKMLDEFLALAYHKEFGLPVVILRLFNIVGPRQSSRYGMVIPRLVSQAITSQPITVYGNGEQTRCFTYVGDAVDAAIGLSLASEPVGEVINLGNDQEVTINDLAALIKDTLNSDSPIVHVPYSEAFGADFEDVVRRVPDVSKIRRYIDFRPSTDLGWVIKQVAHHLQERPGLAGEK